MTVKNIYSVGYGGRVHTDFIQLMVKYNITLVVDIRSNPFSRFQPSYNKAGLKAILKEEGINYVFMGEELGGKPKAQIFYSPSGKLNQELVTTTKFYQSAIRELIELAHINENICLLCSELNPDQCHRKTMVGQSLFKQGVIVNHINGKGGVDKHSNSNLLFTLF